LGESGSFNYILYADHATPVWYLTDQGAAKGAPIHRVRKILDDPPTYEFANGQPVTHPLRFDPSYWTQGLKPAFTFRGQRAAIHENVSLIEPIIVELGGMILGFIVLFVLTGSGLPGLRDLIEAWPVSLLGIAGLLMYAPIHVESRYVGAFFLLLWLGLLAPLRFRKERPAIVAAVILAISASLLFAAAQIAYAPRHYRWNTSHNLDAEIADELAKFGTQPGDPVARISTAGYLGWARAAGVTIVAEVDLEVGAVTFWKSDPASQARVLQALRQTGAKAVVGHCWDEVTAPGWHQVGKSHYWIYPFNAST
jgi:hypothetical protein